MTSEPLISVVLPVFNHERFVAEAIRSVFAQTWRPIELIVIDDGSTDGSAAAAQLALASEAGRGGVAASFLSRPNRGAPATINEGVLASRGDFVAILNSDDAFHPDRLAECLAVLRERKARLAFSYVTGIDADGAPLPAGHPWRRWYDGTIYKEMHSEPSTSVQFLHSNSAVSTGNLVFHRSLFDGLGGFRDFPVCHDLDFLLRAAYEEEPVLIRRALYFYRLHGANTNPTDPALVQPEIAAVVRSYLDRALREPPLNPLAPGFGNWGGWMHAGGAAFELMAAMDTFVEAGSEAPQLRPLPAPLSVPLVEQGAGLTIVTHELTRTGAPLIALQIAREARAAGIAAEIVSLLDGPLRADAVEAGIPLRLRPDRRAARLALRTASRWSGRLERAGAALDGTAGPGRGLGGALRLTGRRLGEAAAGARAGAMLASGGPVLVNSFASWPFVVALLRSGPERPLFWYVHESFRPEMLLPDAKAVEMLRQAVGRGRIRMMFGSRATEALWRDCGFGGIVRYWSGIPAGEEFRPRSREDARPMLLSVARAGTRKGTMVLLEAFALARREDLVPPEAALCLVGCPLPSKDVLVRDFIIRAHRPDLAGAVRFIGSVAPSAVEEFYGRATLFVQSSIMECLSLSLLEAMRAGLPVVATDVDGTGEAILHEETGLLVPPRDVRALAEAMGRVLTDRDAAVGFGAAARQRFNRIFSLEATVPALLQTVFGTAGDGEKFRQTDSGDGLVA